MTAARGIVMVVIDCLRADHVSAYGYGRATTPTIDQLAEHGVLWEQAHSPSSWTKPSMASLLTGRYPCQHGAFEGVKRSKGRLTTTDAVPDSCPTIAEKLQAAGWRCGAFINNAQLGEFSGLHRGFETYVPRAGKADQLIEQYRAWLDQDTTTPFFAYLHFLEAHWPYKPRRRHVAEFGGDRDHSHFRDFSARDYGRLRRAISREGHVLPDDQLEDMIRMYDGAVRRLDGKVRIVLNDLEARGLRDSTMLMVTADHGEEFLEHGQLGHGQGLYDELTHVPLVIQAPQGPRGLRIAEPVSHVHISDTLLSQAGVESPNGQADLLGGYAPERVMSELRIQGRYFQTIRSRGWKLHRTFKFASTAACEAFTRFDEDLTEVPQIRHELYELSTDPREQHDLATDVRGAAARSRLIVELDNWWDEQRDKRLAGVGCDVEIDDTVVQRLRDLGYLE